MWDDTVIHECFWDTLCSYHHCWELVVNKQWKCSEAAIMCVHLMLTCKRLHTNVSLLQKDIHRPWLKEVDMAYTIRMLTIELATRRMIRSMTTTIVPLIARDTTVTCAGGFVAWELERSINTANGRDAFPRTFSDTSIGNVAPNISYAPMWVPVDIDFFIEADDVELVYDLSNGVYKQYICDMFDCDQANVLEEHAGSYWQDDQDTTSTSYLKRLLEDLLPARWVELWLSQKTDNVPQPELQSTSFSSNYNEPLTPCIVNIIFVKNFDIHTFDFEHCKVSLDVTNAGEYSFRCTPNAIKCLSERRLESAIKCPHANTKRLVNRIIKYVRRGFSIPGTPLTCTRHTKGVDICSF